MMHGLAIADEVVQSNSLLLPAVITAIGGGIAAIIAVAPGMIRAIREDEADDLKGLIRRVYYWLQEKNSLEQLPRDLLKDMTDITTELEKPKTEKVKKK